MQRKKKDPASQGHLKVLERLKNEKHIEELLNGLERIMALDNFPLRQLILESGLPGSSQAFKYLQYNQQVKHEPDRTLRLCLVVVINNRQVDRFRLRGIKKALSQKLFAFSKNRMDIFINSLRCNEGMMSLMAEAPHNFSLLGILQIDAVERKRFHKRRHRAIRPVVLIPDVNPIALRRITTFENAQEIRKTKCLGLPFYRKDKRPADRIAPGAAHPGSLQPNTTAASGVVPAAPPSDGLQPAHGRVEPQAQNKKQGK